MFTELIPYKVFKDVCYLNIKVIPKSSRQISGSVIIFDNKNYWKIYLLSHPENGKANKELIEFLSKRTGVNKSSINIHSGITTQYKILQIIDVSANFCSVLNCVIFG